MSSYRVLSDPIADQLVREVYEKLPKEAIGPLYRQLMNDIEEIDYYQLPEVFHPYFEEQQVIPKWMDPLKVILAEQIFLDLGQEYSTLLVLRALPAGYASRNIVKLLDSTGYLSSDLKTGTAKRLYETSQFLFNVMRRDTFKKDSIGLKHTLKVRFVHAMVRHHVMKKEWNQAAFGYPINQEDMAFTILTFSIGAIIGLEKLGLTLSISQKDALVHYWALIGAVIGVEDAINPKDFESASALYHKIINEQAEACEEGIKITRALCQFINGTFKYSWMAPITDYMIRYLIDNDAHSDMIGLDKPKGLIQETAFRQAIQLVKALNKRRELSLVQFVMKPVNKVFAQSILNYFDAEFDLKLSIPMEMRQAWGMEG